MKKILAIVLAIAILICGTCVAFLGSAFLKQNEFQKDIKALEHFEFEVLYNITGESDIFGIAQYEAEETPIVTKWFASYLNKIQQGGRITGEMNDEVYHADVYAKGDDEASVEFYYDKDAVFSVNKTINYIIATIADQTKLPISILQTVIPEGYISYYQMKTILGEEEHKASATDFIEVAEILLRNLRLRIPSEMKECYFQKEIEGLDMSYYSAVTSINGEDEIKLDVGIQNEAYDKYIHLNISDFDGDADIEILIHIRVTDVGEIVVPETISDEIVEPLASVIALINNMKGKN